MVEYEYPFNERIRTLLRLEHLFERFAYFFAKEDPQDHHAAITTLFEISDVASRADLKADLLKELERQRGILAMLRENPKIDGDALEQVIVECERAQRSINAVHGKAGQHLTDNEWLTSLRSRTIIPGGTCKFDLPSYYAWQQGSVEARRGDIEKWVAPLLPLRNGTAIVLRLLRESGCSTEEVAVGGSFQQMLSGRSYLLMQVRMQDASLVPEISANKYMLWIRMTRLDGGDKPKPVEIDVPFTLTLCNF
ncbi:MAG: cell division protein ZapD [Candidatus Protistobacter heckmanni]|nr:cell division protein ZapD [Candidatus Protistobacter heckmanni]